MPSPVVKSPRQHLRLSVNPALVDKIQPTDKRSFSRGFQPEEFTLQELAEVVSDFGYAFSYQYIGGIRNTRNFRATDFLAVDVDENLRIPEALKHDVVRKYGSLLYTTPSHTIDSHRFRIVFILPRTITDARELRAAAYALTRRLGGDTSATDAARIFYGSSGCDYRLLGNQISAPFLTELIEDGYSAPAPDSIARLNQLVTVRSRLRVDRDQKFKTREGRLIPICEAKGTVSVFCPFHIDKNASGFIARSRKGRVFFHCSTCRATWYVKGQNLEDYDFNGFETLARTARANRQLKAASDLLGLESFAANPPEWKIKGITISENRYLKLDSIPTGLTFIKSPKGSGKTEFLRKVLTRATQGTAAGELSDYAASRGEGRSGQFFPNLNVLLIGHRQALIRELSQKLGLNCYLDDVADKSLSDGEADRKRRYAVCVDSLWKVKRTPEDVKKPNAVKHYDLVVIDEVEQVLAHFMSDTLGEERYKMFGYFCELVSRANVVALDADLGWISFNTIVSIAKLWSPNPQRNIPVQVFLNDWKKKGEKIHFYKSQSHLIEVLKQRILSGERIFVTSNSKRKIKAIASAIDDFFEDIPKHKPKMLVITSENSKTAEIQKFITNVKTEILNYQVILTSPSLGTGLDITFENDSQEIDAVFGLFENLINTHLEIDQQLARVRNPKETHVWVSATQHNFETEFKVVKEDYLLHSFRSSFFGGYPDGNAPTLPKWLSLFDTMAAMIVAHQRASKNRLRINFLDYRKSRGTKIIEVAINDDLSKEGAAFIAIGKSKLVDEEIAEVLNAKVLTREEMDDIRERMDSNDGVVDRIERLAYYRTNLENFYGTGATKILVALDDNGRFRKKVRAFEALVTPESIKRAQEGKESIKASPKVQAFRESIYQNRDSAQLLLHDLLLSTPIYRNYTFNRSIFTLKDLKRFASLSLKLKKFTDTHLGIIVRRDVTSKPVLQLKKVLDCVGLEYWWASVRVVAGKKIYSYRLSRDTLGLMKDILTVQRRARRKEMDSLLNRQTVPAPSILRKRVRAENLKRISGSILV